MRYSSFAMNHFIVSLHALYVHTQPRPHTKVVQHEECTIPRFVRLRLYFSNDWNAIKNKQQWTRTVIVMNHFVAIAHRLEILALNGVLRRSCLAVALVVCSQSTSLCCVMTWIWNPYPTIFATLSWNQLYSTALIVVHTEDCSWAQIAYHVKKKRPVSHQVNQLLC